jgi:hypothetical protein
MAIRRLDTLLALKVLTLVPELNASDRRVAGALLEHFNRNTAQCDPGLPRIADLLGLSTRTVMRSNRRLEAARLFKKTRHGGRSHRNSYEPNWARFQELEGVWREKFNHKSRMSKESLLPRQDCHVDGDSAGAQTCDTNLLKATYPKTPPTKENRRPPYSRQNSATPSSSDAARVAAERRWTTALHNQFAAQPRTYGEVIAAINESISSGATEAEMHKRGAGIIYILNQLRIPHR